MKCIVTAGPTYEELDEVRRLTNFSTGTLGTELANYLTDQGHEVILFRGYYSTCQIEPKAREIHVFTTTADLARQLKRAGSPKTGAVFHAAAVSDFSFGRIWRRAEIRALAEIKSRKISTRGGTILAELKPTPKIISYLPGWFPNARLVGWKYEVDGDRAQATTRGKRQLKESLTHACVVNGPAYGKGFGFVTRGGRSVHLADRLKLFGALAGFLKSTPKARTS